MVTSTDQPSGANSTLEQMAEHQTSRRVQQGSPSAHPVGSSPSVGLSGLQTAHAHASPRQHPPRPAGAAGPSVVSRYMLPAYRQASSSTDRSSSLSQLNTSSNPAIHPLNASLPDILHSHLVPQVPPHRPNQRRQHTDRTRNHHRERHRSETDGPRNHARNERRRTQSSSSSAQPRENSCKEPCVKCVVTVTSFRWVLVALSILGVACVVSGVVLAALHAVGSSFLFLAVMFIGLGILLVIVVSVGWRCTPRGHEPLHALFNIGQFGSGGTRERHRRRRHRHRDGNWFGGVMYPEFQYRRPPPSYVASMQDYQNQSLHDLTSARQTHESSHERHGSLSGSPPPSYHSRTSTMHSGMNITGQDSTGNSLPNSRPPTYRSRAPSRRPSLPRHESLQGNETQQSLQGNEAPRSISRQNSNPESMENFSQGLLGGENAAECGSGNDVAVSPPVSSPTIAATDSPDSIAASSTNQAELQQPGSTIISSSPTAGHEGTYSLHTEHQLGSQGAGADVGAHFDGSEQQNREMGLDGIEGTVSTRNQSSSPDPVTPNSLSFMHSLPNTQETYESDAQQLQQALQPLEAMEESEGIDNLGANVSSDTDYCDTHL